jgi:hypothetical protein
MTNIREAHTFGDSTQWTRVAYLRSDKVQCLTYQTQVLRRMIWISAVEDGVLIDKRREGRIDSQVNEQFTLRKKLNAFARAANRPRVGHHQKHESDTKPSVCYNAVTALTSVSAKMQWVRSVPPGPFRPPDNSSIGCADGGSATGALELPPLFPRATLRFEDRFCHA